MKKNKLIDISRIKSLYDIKLVFTDMYDFSICFNRVAIRPCEISDFCADWIVRHIPSPIGSVACYYKPCNLHGEYGYVPVEVIKDSH